MADVEHAPRMRRGMGAHARAPVLAAPHRCGHQKTCSSALPRGPEKTDPRSFETAQAVAQAATAAAECIVCKDQRVDRALGCGHLFCHRCAAVLRLCPLCKQVISAADILRIFI